LAIETFREVPVKGVAVARLVVADPSVAEPRGRVAREALPVWEAVVSVVVVVVEEAAASAVVVVVVAADEAVAVVDKSRNI
jgi:hypothetical protein